MWVLLSKHNAWRCPGEAGGRPVSLSRHLKRSRVILSLWPQQPRCPHQCLWHLPGEGDIWRRHQSGWAHPPLPLARGQHGAAQRSARSMQPWRPGLDQRWYSGCQALPVWGTGQRRLQGHGLWGRGGPAAATLQRRRSPDLPVSLVRQAPLLPREAYRLSANSRSHWRKEEDKEGFKKKITKRKTVISNPNLALQWLC